MTALGFQWALGVTPGDPHPEVRDLTPAEGSPCVDEDGVLIQPVVHADLQVYVGLWHPDWHVDSNTDDFEI